MNKNTMQHIKLMSEVKYYTLDNGLRLFALSRHDVPSVNIHIGVTTGSIHEGKYLGYGLSHILEHMMFQGCAGYPDQAVSDLINKLGGDINACTSYDDTRYMVNLPSKYWRHGVSALASMLTSPELPAAKLKKELKVILRERDMVRDRPERLLTEITLREAFLVHPIRYPIIGFREHISKVSRDILMDYYHNRYSPERCFIVIVGDINPEQTFALINQKFGKWQRGNLQEPTLPVEPLQSCQRERTDFFKDPLARITYNYRISDGNSPDSPAVSLLNAVIESLSSRMAQNILINKELALDFYSYCFSAGNVGLMNFSTLCMPEKMAEMEKVLREETALIAAGKITEPELEREKNKLIFSYLQIMRSGAGIAKAVQRGVASNGTANAVEKYIDRLNKTTLDEVKTAANCYLQDDRLTICRLLPAEQKNTIAHKKTRNKQTLPELHHLPRAVRLVSYYRPELPLTDFSLIMPGGRIKTTADTFGIHDLAADMLTAGTKELTENKLTELMEKNSIILSTATTLDSTQIAGSCPAGKFKLTMDILQDILTESTFSAKEFKRKQTNAVKNIESSGLSPLNAAMRRVKMLAYGSHPYATPADGGISSINALKPAQAKHFFHNHLVSAKTVFGIGGEYDCDAAISAFTKLIKAIQWNDTPENRLIKQPVFPSKDCLERIVSPREQSAVVVSLPGCCHSSPDLNAVAVILYALNGLSANLFKKIREDAALAYNVGANFSSGSHPGIFSIIALTKTDKESEVLELINAERLRLANCGLEKAEFEAARDALIFSRIQDLDSPAATMNIAVNDEFSGQGFMEPWRSLKQLQKISLDEVNGAAAKYFNSKIAAITVIAGKDK